MDEFDRSMKHIVETLLCAALLSLLISRDLLDLITKKTDGELVFPPERWAATFRSHPQLILHELNEYLGSSSLPLLGRLTEERQKIHQHRPVFQDFLDAAIQLRVEV